MCPPSDRVTPGLSTVHWPSGRLLPCLLFPLSANSGVPGNQLGFCSFISLLLYTHTHLLGCQELRLRTILWDFWALSNHSYPHLQIPPPHANLKADSCFWNDCSLHFLTEYPTLSGLNNRHLFSQSRRLESTRSRFQLIWFLLRACRGPPFSLCPRMAFPLCVGTEGELCGVSLFIRTLIWGQRLTFMTSFNLDYFLRDRIYNTGALKVRAST